MPASPPTPTRVQHSAIKFVLKCTHSPLPFPPRNQQLPALNSALRWQMKMASASARRATDAGSGRPTPTMVAAVGVARTRSQHGDSDKYVFGREVSGSRIGRGAGGRSRGGTEAMVSDLGRSIKMTFWRARTPITHAKLRCVIAITIL